MPHTPKPYRMLRDVFDLALQTGAPLIVRRRCNPHQLAVWMAVRFLIDTTERTAFGSREIADEAGLTSYPRVAGWLDDLVHLDLLEIAGYEEIKGGVIKGVRRDRPIYRIPWKRIFSDSLIAAEKHLAGTAQKRGKGRPSEGHELQLPLEFPVTDRSLEQLPIDHGSSDRSVTDGSDRLIAEAVTDRSLVSDRLIAEAVTDRSHMDGRMDGRGGKDGSRAPHARKQLLPEPIPPVPPSPPPNDLFAAHPQWVARSALSAHPLELWRKACARPRPIEDEHLTALALEHDSPTGGHGWFWVGQAILASAQSADVYSVAKVRRTLERWRNEDSYGSDLPRRGTHDNEQRNDRDTGRRSRALRSGHRVGDSPTPAAGSAPTNQRDDPARAAPDDDVPAYLQRRDTDYTRRSPDVGDDTDIPDYLR